MHDLPAIKVKGLSYKKKANRMAKPNTTNSDCGFEGTEEEDGRLGFAE